MQNEILLLVSLFLTFLTVVFLFWLFQEQGLYLWTVLATIAAHIGNDAGQYPVCLNLSGNGHFERALWEKSRPDCGLPWDCHFSHLHFLEPVLDAVCAK